MRRQSANPSDSASESVSQVHAKGRMSISETRRRLAANQSRVIRKANVTGLSRASGLNRATSRRRCATAATPANRPGG